MRNRFAGYSPAARGGLAGSFLLVLGLLLAACGEPTASVAPPTAPSTTAAAIATQAQTSIVSTTAVTTTIPATTMAAATTVLQPTTTAATTAAKPQPPVGVQVGLTAPDFTAKLVNGENITLSQLRGKAVLINFWSVY